MGVFWCVGCDKVMVLCVRKSMNQWLEWGYRHQGALHVQVSAMRETLASKKGQLLARLRVQVRLLKKSTLHIYLYMNICFLLSFILISRSSEQDETC